MNDGWSVEVAKLVWAAYRYRDKNGKKARLYIAGFILIGVYTGSRAGVIASAALQYEPRRPYFDLDRGLFYRKPEGVRETIKRRPTIPIPTALAGHIRRWRRLGTRYAVEWLGRPVNKIDHAFRDLVAAVGLSGDVMPHTLRHTCATWLCQRGEDRFNIAGYVGMPRKNVWAPSSRLPWWRSRGVPKAIYRQRFANV